MLRSELLTVIDLVKISGRTDLEEQLELMHRVEVKNIKKIMAFHDCSAFLIIKPHEYGLGGYIMFDVRERFPPGSSVTLSPVQELKVAVDSRFIVLQTKNTRYLALG